jgi:hypothetical protein
LRVHHDPRWRAGPAALAVTTSPVASQRTVMHVGNVGTVARLAPTGGPCRWPGGEAGAMQGPPRKALTEAEGKVRWC